MKVRTQTLLLGRGHEVRNGEKTSGSCFEGRNVIEVQKHCLEGTWWEFLLENTS